MGRNRKPDAQKIADGDRKDRINDASPISPPGLGPAPKHLGLEATVAWYRLSELIPEGVATVADQLAAELWSQAYATWEECRAIIADNGGMMIQEDRDGYSITKAHPILPTMLGLQKQMADLLGKFGLTPSARSALSMGRRPDTDPLIDYVKNRDDPTEAGRSEVDPD